MTGVTALRPHPSYPGRFVGRVDELRDVSRRLGPGRTVGVVGPGGVGKTRFVSQLLRGRSARSAYVDASAARRPDQLVGALVRDLGASGRDAVDAVIRRLDEAGVGLLFVDCLEGVGPGAAPVLSRLVAPGRGVVYTSRVALEAPEEVRVTLEPLLDPLDQRELFLEVAGPSAPDERHLVDRVLTHLDGIPLAIELAAARLTVLSLAELEAQVATAPASALRDPSRPTDRSTTLWRSIAWSVDLLPATARDVFAQVGVFAGAFTADAAAAVAGRDVARELAALEAWHLARSQDGRLELYDSVREFAAAELDARPDATAVHLRHGDWVLGATRDHHRPLDAHLTVVRSALPELDRVVDRGAAPGASAEAVRRARLAAHVTYYADRERMPIEALDARLAALLAQPPDPSSLDVAADRLRHLPAPHPGHEPAVRHLLELGRAWGSPRHAIWATQQLAHAAARRGDDEGARELLLPALAEVRELGNAALEAQLLLGPLNRGPMLRGEHAEVEARMARAEALVADSTDGNQRAQVLLNVGVFHLNVGRWQDARDRFDQAFACAPLVHGAQNHDLGLWMRVMLEVGERGPGAVEAVEALLAKVSPRFVDDRRAWMVAMRAVARRLAGLGEPVEAVIPAGAGWDDELAGLVLAAAVALDHGPAPLPPERHADPAARAVRAVAEQVMGVVGGAEPSEAERWETAAPLVPCLWLHPARWVLRAAIRERRERDARFTVGAGGRWVRPPGGAVVTLAAAPARILTALLAGPDGGLDAAALFAAGWPGDHAAPHAAANRVRVALDAVRRAGLTVDWRRGRGWRLATPVTVEPPG